MKITQLLMMITLSWMCSEVSAHARWNPEGVLKPRSNNDNIKSGPCGVPRGNSPVVLQAGQTLEVDIDARIYHRGYFRIAFSPANDEGFDDNVLANNIPDISGRRHSKYTITLPDVECDQCTLQLIQVMLDRNPPTNYFSCADIQLVKDTSVPDDVTPPSEITNLVAVPADQAIQLMWTNPSEEDYARTLILQSDQAIQATLEDQQDYLVNDTVGNATIVYHGSGENTNLSPLISGLDYYFKVFTADQSLNYSAGVSTQSAPVSMPNVAPVVELVLEQNGRTENTVYVEDGSIIVQANVNDANADDSHQYDWSSSDQSLNGQPNGIHFSIDPSQLDTGFYKVVLFVADDGNPNLTTRAELNLDVRKRTSSRGGSLGFLVLLGLSLSLTLLRRRN